MRWFKNPPRLALAVTLVLAGCTSEKAAGDASAPRVLRLSFHDQLRSLNPLYIDGYNGAAIDALAFSYLLRPLPDGRLVPDVALEVPTLSNGGLSPDGKTITYHLRHGVRWQDGAPLTSADVAFTARAVVNPNNTVGERDPYDRIAAIETPDAYTVRVRLRAPDAAVAGLFLTPDANAAILPAHLLSRYASLDRAPFNVLPIGSGPYRVVAWDRGSTIRFAANPTYFGGAPKLPAVELRYMPDSNTGLIQLQTGELGGVIGGDAALLERYRALPGRRVTVVPYTGASLLGFNTERPVLANPAMRRALAQAVDVDALAREAYHGAVTPKDATRGFFSWADDPRAPWPHYDPAAAARELDALGWRRSPSGVRRRDGQDLVLTMIATTTDKSAPVILQQQFARLGVRVTIQSFIYSEFWAHASDGGVLANGRFDLGFFGYSTNVDPDQAWLLACRNRAPHGYNESRYCNPQVDALLAASSRALERSRRIAILQQVQRLVARDVPFLPLWQTSLIDVTPDWLRGFVPNGMLPFDSARNWSAQ